MIAIARTALAALLPLFLIACEPAPPEPEQEPEPPAAEVDESPATVVDANPLLERYLTPFRTPPFHRLEAAHFLPALNHVIDEHREVLAELVEHDQGADFANTIEALEHAGRDLGRIERTFFGLLAVSDDAELHEIAPEFSARLAAHLSSVLFDRDLFERVESVYQRRDEMSLEPEEHRLTELTHKRFVRGGALLDDSQQERLEEINTRLAELGRRFDRDLRESTREHEFLVEDDALPDALPETLVNLAARSARDRGHATGWAFTLHPHSLVPFLMHFPDRDQRQAMYEAWDGRVDHELEAIMLEMAELRAERAALLGFDTHVDYLVADSMIADREQLRSVLDRLSEAAAGRAASELEELERLARADGVEDELQPWDWWYYRERLREQAMDQTDAELRDWFSLEQVRDGAFALANRLWGLSLHARTDIPLWYTDVEAFEVRDAMGEHLGVIYLDHRHREGKRMGSRTSVYRLPHRDGDERIRPVVANVTQFPPPAAGLPSLLSADEVSELFRQFGHALAELFSEVSHGSLASSAAPLDFSGFPARMMAHWALQPEVLRMYAYHHETGGMITDQAINALTTGQGLLGGLETQQQLAAIEFELALHGAAAGEVPEIRAALDQARENLQLPPLLSARHHDGGVAELFAGHRERSHFQSLWSELLAADAFAAFTEATILDRNLAETLRNEVMTPGNSRDPMASWQAFRDREPRLDYLLEARGLGD
jgi:peptidyl-dipeptidase Dcp